MGIIIIGFSQFSPRHFHLKKKIPYQLINHCFLDLSLCLYTCLKQPLVTVSAVNFKNNELSFVCVLSQNGHISLSWIFLATNDTIVWFAWDLALLYFQYCCLLLSTNHSSALFLNSPFALDSARIVPFDFF